MFDPTDIRVTEAEAQQANALEAARIEREKAYRNKWQESLGDKLPMSLSAQERNCAEVMRIMSDGRPRTMNDLMHSMRKTDAPVKKAVVELVKCARLVETVSPYNRVKIYELPEGAK